MTSEVVKTPDGEYRMRFYGEDGQVLRMGTIHLPPDPERDERSRRAVQTVLRRMYEEQEAAKA